MPISKTDFIRGLQCEKMLWLDAHAPEYKIIPPEVQAKLDAGNEFGDNAMSIFGDFVETTAFREDGRLYFAKMIENTQALLAQDTPVILMDEPTTFLDISHQMKVMRIAKELSVQGKSVVMVLHDLSQAFETADQLILLSEGKIVAKGSPEDVYQSRAADVVFQIQLTRIKTQKGWKYFCE